MVGLGCGSLRFGLHHASVSLIFGTAVMTAILLFARWSGAHINPAVTLALWRAGRLPSGSVMPYIIAQCCGALCASVLLAGAAPTQVEPSLSLIQAFFIEFSITFLLMLSIFFIINKTSSTLTIAIWVGLTVSILAFIAGPYTGASMNPARTFGPNLVAGMWYSLPFYFSSTTLGAWLAHDLYTWCSQNLASLRSVRKGGASQ